MWEACRICHADSKRFSYNCREVGKGSDVLTVFSCFGIGKNFFAEGFVSIRC